MLKAWIEERCVQWLVSRGWLVMRASVPSLVVSYGVGTRKPAADGGTVYQIVMPSGHQLYTLMNSVITTEPEQQK